MQIYYVPTEYYNAFYKTRVVFQRAVKVRIDRFIILFT